MDKEKQKAVIAGIIVAAVVSLIFGISAAQTYNPNNNNVKAQDQPQDKCQSWNTEIEKNRGYLQQAQSKYDEKNAIYQADLKEYNKKWFPAPSYTAQINQEQYELQQLSSGLDQAYAVFNADVDRYNQQCASG
jgi:hypothetical protein